MGVQRRDQFHDASMCCSDKHQETRGINASACGITPKTSRLAASRLSSFKLLVVHELAHLLLPPAHSALCCLNFMFCGRGCRMPYLRAAGKVPWRSSSVGFRVEGSALGVPRNWGSWRGPHYDIDPNISSSTVYGNTLMGTAMQRTHQRW